MKRQARKAAGPASNCYTTGQLTQFFLIHHDENTHGILSFDFTAPVHQAISQFPVGGK